MAPCGGCGSSRRAASGAWLFVLNGTEYEYPTEIKAREAMVRAGGAGEVKPKPA